MIRWGSDDSSFGSHFYTGLRRNDRGGLHCVRRFNEQSRHAQLAQRSTPPGTLMSKTAFCYHCATHHPKADMRQIVTKGGSRWRCIKSIKASQMGPAERAAFGRQTTAINKADMEAAKRRMTNPDRNNE